MLKPEDIAATVAGGILGNRSDALFVEAMQGLRQRMRDGNLADINHDVERASFAALHEAIAIFTEEVAARVGDKPPLLAAYQRRKREGSLDRIEAKLDGMDGKLDSIHALLQANPPKLKTQAFDLSRLPNRHDDGVFVGRESE